MAREVDQVWRHVILLDQKARKWRCRFCQKSYHGGPSRIKAHLAGVPGQGIASCEKVSAQVKSEVLESSRRQGAVRSSSSAPLPCAPPHQSLPQSDAVDSLVQLPDSRFSSSYGVYAPYASPGPLNAEGWLPSAAPLPWASLYQSLPQSHAVDSLIQVQDSSFSSSYGVQAPYASPGPLHAEEGPLSAAALPWAPPHQSLPQSDAVDSRIQLQDSIFSSSYGVQAPYASPGPLNAEEGGFWAQVWE